MKLNFQKVFCFSIVLFFVHISFAINIRYIKDTYTILKPEFKQLSSASGPIWWEKNIVRNIYTYGLVGEDPGNRTKEGVQYPNFPYGTVQLTRLLFHEVQGSFNLTRAPGNPATYLTPRILGRLIGMLEITRAEIQSTAKSQKNANDMQKSLSGRLDQFIAKELAGNEAYNAGIEKGYQSITRAKPSLAEYKNVIEKRLARAIIASLEESGFFEILEAKGKQKSQAYYPPFTTYNILLTFLYRKAEDIKDGVSVGKADYKEYFIGLLETMQTEILTLQGRKLFESEAWLRDIYDDSEVAIDAYLVEIRAALEAAPKQEEKTVFAVSLLDQLYEKMVFAELWPKGLPDLAEYRESYFEGQKFTDCMDTTMRNAFNIVTFDNGSNTFVLAKVLDVHPAQPLVDYYSSPVFKKASEIENPDAHNAWNVVIQNSDYIAYERILDRINPEARTSVAAQEHKFQGFLRATDSLRQRTTGQRMAISFKDGSAQEFDLVDISDKKFVLIDPAKYVAYEVEPSLQNMIVLMNRLLGLELYPDINDAFFVQGFNATYFPLLAEKLGWEYEDPAVDLDNADYSKEGIVLAMNTSGGSLELEVRWGHGRFMLQSALKIDEVRQNLFNDIRENLILRCLEKKSFVSDPFLMNLFALYQYEDAYGFEAMIGGLQDCRPLRTFACYSQRLQDSNIKLRVIRELVKIKDSEMFDLCALAIQRLPAGADLYYLKQLTEIDFSKVMGNKGQYKKITTALINTYDSILSRPIDVNLILVTVRFLTMSALFDEKAIEVAMKSVMSKDSKIFSASIEIFEKLFEKNMGYAEALVAAQNGIAEGMSAEALDLFEKLVKRGYGYIEATQAVRQVISKEGLTYQVFKAMGALVVKEQVYEMAMQVAEDGSVSDSMLLRGGSMYLFVELVKKGFGYEKAIQAVLRSIEFEDVLDKTLAFGLISALVEKNQAHDVAIKIAKAEFVSDDRELRKKSIELFSKLFEKGQGFDVAIELASKGTGSLDIEIRMESFELFDKVLEKNRGYDALAAVVLRNVAQEDLLVAFASIQFMTKLVENGKGYEAAIALVKRAIELHNEFIFDLLGRLVEKGQAYDIALKRAKALLADGIEAGNSSQIASALELFGKLVEMGQGYNQAREAASRDYRSKSFYIEEALSELRKKLKEKGVSNL